MAKLSGSSGDWNWTAVKWRGSGGREYPGGPSKGALHNADRLTVAVTPVDNPSKTPRYFTIHGPWDDLDVIDDIVDAAMGGYGDD